jgi:hypothetical protein
MAYADAQKVEVKLVTRDNDQIYKKGFDRVMKEAGVEPRRLAIRAPNTNAYVERFIQTLQVECLDHFLVFGEKHLDYLIREYVEHYHAERNHQGKSNVLLFRRVAETRRDGPVQCRGRLGGLLRYYHQDAA